MSLETIERSFEVKEPASLLLKNPRGRVEIMGGEEGRILITAVVHLESGRLERTHVEIEQTSDGSVSAITDYDGNSWFGFSRNRPCLVDYVVRVPQSCNLELSIVEGHGVIQGLVGDLRAASVSGTLSLRDLSGTLEFSTVSGRITAEALQGPLRVKTVSGNVRLERSELPRLDAHTVSGGLSIETPLFEGPYAIHSVSGGAKVYLPPQTNCSLKFHTLSGRLNVDLDELRRFNGRGELNLNVGNGGAALKFDSISADLHLLPSEAMSSGMDDYEEDRSTEAGAGPAHDRMEVLEKIARGELSVEEALSVLSRC